MSELKRLNKYLAETLGISRREADDLIAAKKVTINGEVAVLGQRFIATDILMVRNKLVSNTDKEYTYLIMNKPVGYVCSRRQQGDNPTVYELLPEKYQALKTVGRLDKDSSGLLLFTDDGDFAHQMTHPKFNKIKVYEVELATDLAPLHHQMINDNGITLEDGPSRLTLERIKEGNDKKWRITMHEGRNRQIRRTFESLGYNVKKLHRTNFGDYLLDDLAENNYKVIAK